MNRFTAFIRKEFYHIFRDKRTLTILFGMPVVQIMLFGFAITNEINNAEIAILDQSKDELTSKITDKILASDYFTLSDNLSCDEEIEGVFKKGGVKMVVIYEPDFSKKMTKEHTASVQLIADASDPNTANTLINYAQAIIFDFTKEHNHISSLPLAIDVKTKMYYNPELKGVYFFVPGLICILLMLVSAMMTSISIAKEKEIGTMEILLASPMKPIQVIVAKVIPYLLMSFLIANIILILGKFVFGVPILGSVFLLQLESILFIVMALCLGIFISTVTDSQQTALLSSLMGLMLPTIILSGFIFPIENMPLPLQIISNIIPAKWFIIIIKSIMLKGAGFESIWRETMVLMFFTLFFIGLSAKKYKLRLE